MWDLGGKPEEKFSHNEAQLLPVMHVFVVGSWLSPGTHRHVLLRHSAPLIP